MPPRKTPPITRRRFDPEYRARAVATVQAGTPAAQVARDLDLNYGTLANWLAQARRPTATIDEKITAPTASAGGTPLHVFLQRQRRFRFGTLDLEQSWEKVSEATGGEPPGPRLSKLARDPKPSETYTTPWGTVSYHLENISPAFVMGIAKAFDVPPKVVWLHEGVSLGLPGLFDDPADEMLQMLPKGWQHMDEVSFGVWRRLGALLVDRFTDHDEVARLRARVAELEAQLAEQPVPATRRTRTR